MIFFNYENYSDEIKKEKKDYENYFSAKVQ